MISFTMKNAIFCRHDTSTCDLYVHTNSTKYLKNRRFLIDSDCQDENPKRHSSALVKANSGRPD